MLARQDLKEIEEQGMQKPQVINMKRKSHKFDFDVAISCAGEDRRPAERLAKSLRTKGFSVFYDLDYRSYLWGKKEGEFQRIYGPASRFFVPIISAHYKEKEWCRFEFDIAREEAKKRKEEFILPIRLDDSKILGLREDTSYLDLRQMSVSKIAQELNKKIKFGCQLPEAISYGTRRQRVQILTQYSRKVLGIIAVCPFPVRIEHFEKIFPQIEWRKEIRFFRRAGLLEREPRSLRVNKSVKRSLLSEPEEAKIFHQSWIQALEPLKKHTDIALILALQYIALKQFDEAVMVLANIAAGMEPDWWNDAYLAIFKIMNEKQLLRRLSPEPRLQFCNAMGLCLSRAGNYKEALKWFLKLRAYSKRVGSAWGLGQSYINCGVAHYHVGDTAKAERCYRKSAEHARQTNDKLLLGRSLHNLAMIIMGRDTDAAMQLIDESLSLKKSAGDQVGIVGTYIAHGILAAQEGQLLQAIKWFKKAEKKARAFDLRHTLAFIIGNLGAAHVDLNRFKEAFVYYREARKIAEEEKDQDGLTFIVQGEGLARARNREFGKAEALFHELVGLKKLSGDIKGVIIALHDLGISLIKQRKGSKARQVLSRALGLARRTRNLEWIYRCHLSSAL
jgi:tetratricopeptide (TPR) repeat protein